MLYFFLSLTSGAIVYDDPTHESNDSTSVFRLLDNPKSISLS